ncbi:hypothetical protein [Bernardetia sp.]|uniref:hypothetical protein n=1 Tax=Bernardetia sp. TaxID=1937974 RepID=UPI0025C65813|nr:hypothetical protein [Bernardetia sp.]
MKYIRTMLHPLRPFLPASLLLATLLWFGYSHFLKEKYTENEKMIFEEGIRLTKELSYQYYEEFTVDEGIIYEGDYIREFAMRKAYSELYTIDRKLDSLKQTLIVNELDNIKFLENTEIPITSIFEKYVTEAQEIAPLLKERYTNFELEDGLDNSQLNQLYFSRDSLESKYHLARFQTQLTKMYADDIQLIRQKTITNKIEAILSNYVTTIHLSENRNYNSPDGRNNALYLTTLFPFDTIITKIIEPRNLETQFDEKGFLIIPPSLRKQNTKLVIKIISETDSVSFTYKR